MLNRVPLPTYKVTNQYNFSDDEIATFRDIFSQFDKDGDGTLATKYIGTIMRSLGQSPTEADLHNIKTRLDKLDFELKQQNSNINNIRKWRHKGLHRHNLLSMR